MVLHSVHSPCIRLAFLPFLSHGTRDSFACDVMDIDRRPAMEGFTFALLDIYTDRHPGRLAFPPLGGQVGRF